MCYKGMEQVKIYTLSGPKGVRYVGKTIQSLKDRLSGHLSSKSNDHRGNWISSLKARGIKPTINLIDLVDEDVWQESEMYWIKKYKDEGFILTNTSAGGEDGGHNNKEVTCLDANTGQILATFTSIKVASLMTSTRAGSISQCCLNKINLAGGYKWKHTDNKDYNFKTLKKTKKVSKLDKYTGEVIDTFESTSCASNLCGVSKSQIQGACLSGAISVGFKWKYTDDEDFLFLPHIPKYGKFIDQLDKDTEEVIATFESGKDAERATGVSSSKICQVCKGNREHASGYKWRYTDIGYNDKYNTYSTIQQLDSLSGEVIATFESAAEASRVTGVDSSSISKVCRGRQKTAGGFKWRYAPTN